MNNKLISIIIPVYNGEKYIKRCVQSALNQEKIDFEIIIVNDGSKDNTLKVLKKFEKFENIKIIDIPNGGVSNARNIGIENSNGEYIGFLDCDDTIPKDYYYKLYQALKINNADIVICGMKKIFNDREDIVDIEIDEKCLDKAKFADLYFQLNSKYLLMTVWNKLYKKDLIKNIKFDSLMIMGEDYEFNLEVYAKCTKIAFVKNCLYEYYQNMDSVTYKLKKKYSKAYELENSILYRNFTKKQMKLIGISDKKIEQYLVNRASMWFIKLIENLFLYNNPYNYSTRKEKIKKILNDEENRKYIRLASNNKKNLIVKFLYKINSINFIYFIFKMKVLLR